jgi:Putative DNA-binding domain
MQAEMSAPVSLPKVGAGAFGRAVLDPESDTPSGLIGPDGSDAPKRFNVYRNNVIVSLCEALEHTFPAIKRLLGDEYFSALARAYVLQHPPKSPVLMWYGADFSDFIEAFPPLEGYAYLGDVARVELNWLQAFHAADAAPMDPALLGTIEPDRVGLVRFIRHPAASVVSSSWPIWDLARVNRFEPDNAIEIDLNRSQSVLITRPDLEVDLYLLRPGGDVFLNALFEGATLGDAAAVAQTQCQEFSLSDCLSDCLSSGAFTGLQNDG